MTGQEWVEQYREDLRKVEEAIRKLQKQRESTKSYVEKHQIDEKICRLKTIRRDLKESLEFLEDRYK